jgi:hypothetical protein
MATIVEAIESLLQAPEIHESTVVFLLFGLVFALLYILED